MKIKVICGDITTAQTDAIVNAANPVLLGGGGVDGAIHRSAGPKLKEFCRMLPPAIPVPGTEWTLPAHQVLPYEDGFIRCRPGQVRVTPAFDLPCKWVIHTVGPIFRLQRGGELHAGEDLTLDQATAEETLRLCFLNCGLMAESMGLKSVAFPAISTGIYGCPHDLCARVARNWVRDYWTQNHHFNVEFYLMPDGYDDWLKEFGSESAFGIEV